MLMNRDNVNIQQNAHLHTKDKIPMDDHEVTRVSTKGLEGRRLACGVGAKHYDMATLEPVLLVQIRKLCRRLIRLEVGHQVRRAAVCRITKRGSHDLFHFTLPLWISFYSAVPREPEEKAREECAVPCGSRCRGGTGRYS